jgi:hypothetical protein
LQPSCGLGFIAGFGLRSLAGLQALKCLPDSRDSDFAIREFLDGRYARQAVPDLDQSIGGPVFSQTRQLLGRVKSLQVGCLARFLG